MNNINNLLIKSITTSLLLFSVLGLQAQENNQKSSTDKSSLKTEIVSGMSLDKRALLGGVVISSTVVNISAQVPN